MSTVIYSKEGTFLSATKNIAKLTLNRPQALNAINLELVKDLGEALDKAEADPEIRAIVLTGEGKAFCAGADLKAMGQITDIEEFVESGQKLFKRFEDSPKVTIAAVNGFCVGGGMELVIACDIRIAVADIKLGFPEVSLGLIPAWGGTQRLPYLIGMAKARELILTATLISSDEALNLGLVSKVVPQDELASTAAFLATKVAENAPLALTEAKRSLNASRYLTIEDGNRLEAEIGSKLGKTSDLREGISAMLQKRKPTFKGK